MQRGQQWDPKRHVEKILGRIADGDVTVACWEPGQMTEWACRGSSRMAAISSSAEAEAAGK
jgi:hypothetical protein